MTANYIPIPGKVGQGGFFVLAIGVAFIYFW